MEEDPVVRRPGNQSPGGTRKQAPVFSR